MAQSDHIIEIIIQTNDQTGGALGKVQDSLLALDRAVQRTQERLKRAFGRAYSATVRLIDQVTPAGSKINELLKRLAGKTYQLALRLNDGATNKIRSLEAKLMQLTGKAYTIAVNLRDNATRRIRGLADGALLGMGGMGATMLGTAGIGYGVVNAFQSQMSFEKQMSAVKAIMSGSVSSTEELNAQMKELTEVAEKMGATTKFTAKEAAEGLYYMGMAGWTTEQQKAGLPSILNLAAAGNTDLGTTSDIVTDSLTAFGLKAGEEFEYNGRMIEASKHYADMMATLITTANTDIPKLGQTLKYAAPVIQAMYANGSAVEKMQGAEDAMMITGLMANAGIKDTQAGTSLKSMLARLSGDQRNAYFAQNALGVDFVDQQTGEIRRLKDIVGDFRKAFKEGVDMDKVSDFFEQISGEKIHADTRRKLESYFETAQKNGGKLTGKEMMKMTNLLSGLEAMPGWIAAFLSSEDDWNKIESAMQDCDGAAERMSQIQLDNLAGDITLLGSAWDAFQRNLVKGEASESLRGFVQTITDVITKANELFSDGIQIGDFGKIFIDVINRLKNKFLELDGIGSILAGGALVAGLLKITKTATNLYTKMKSLKSLSIGAGIVPPTPTTSPTGLGGIGSSQQVTSMVVHANSVVVNGRAGNFGGKVGNQAYVDNYYRRRGEILAGQNAGGRPPTTSPTGLSGLARNGLKVAGGASVLAGIFGLMSVYSAKSHSQETLAEADATIAYHRQELARLQSMDGISQEQLNAQQAEVKAAEDFRQRTLKMNNQVERQAEYGAVGAVAGTALGAAIGSFVPVIGTTVGGIIGGILGEFLGTKAADLANQAENNAQQNPGNRANFLEVGNEGIEEIQREQQLDKGVLKDYSRNVTRRREADEAERQRKQHYAEENQRWQSGEGGDFALSQAHNDLINHSEDYEAQNAAAEARHQELIRKGEEVAKKRDAVNKHWQEATGYNSVYGKDYWRGTAEELEALAAYEQDKQNKVIQAAQEQNQTPMIAYGQQVQSETKRQFATEQANRENISSSIFDFFSDIGKKTQSETKKQFESEQSDKNFSIGEFLDELLFNKAAAQSLHEENVTPEKKLPTENESFDLNSILPDFSLSEWLAEKTADIDLASILPDFSAVGEMIGEQLNFIPEKISEIGNSINEGFSQIPNAASEAFNTISSYANEGLTSIQTAWNELPSFFSGLFEGLGGVASAAGAAIASGINSAIGTIQSAWESLSSWLSDKISSLASMASNAAGTIMSFGGGGNVSPKAEGGFISSPQQVLAGEAGLEVIIPLATSRRKRAVDLLKKTAAIVGGDSVNITGDQFKLEKNPATDKQLTDAVKSSESGVAPKFDELGNLEGYGGLADNVITADDDLLVRRAKQEQQLKEFWANNDELGEGLSAEDGAVTGGGGDVDNSIGGIELGGINASFELNGAENPQEFMQMVKENLGDLADQIGGKISEKILEIRMNQPLMA